MDVCRLHHIIKLLFLWRQQVEVQLAGRGQGFYDYLKRITIDPVPQIKQEDTNLGVGHELWGNTSLPQVIAYGVIICKVSIVDERFVETDKRMRSTGMPNSPPGRISLMRYPYMGGKIIELVILDNILGITNNLENHQVYSMGQHKSLFLAK